MARNLSHGFGWKHGICEMPGRATRGCSGLRCPSLGPQDLTPWNMPGQDVRVPSVGHASGQQAKFFTKVPWEAEFLYYPHSVCKNGRDLDWALGKWLWQRNLRRGIAGSRNYSPDMVKGIQSQQMVWLRVSLQ